MFQVLPSKTSIQVYRPLVVVEFKAQPNKPKVKDEGETQSRVRTDTNRWVFVTLKLSPCYIVNKLPTPRLKFAANTWTLL